ncbi:acyltransferase [Nonomuraea sp. NPDC048881]|uniref:acyltransferase family protein n=1 Tax=Nonomuraea sp. NPDC048881 TaxID=3155030 RepID=UPI0033DA6BFD
MKTETGTRLLAVDNLRVLLTALVVAHHVAVTYGNIPLWYYTEPAADPSGTALDILVVFDQAFFMGFFFLVSGFFTPGSHDRKGGRAFVRDRLVRLGVPLLVFLLLLRPLLTIGEHGMPFWKWYIVSWDPGPMWFVEVLIVFALLYAWWRRAGGQRAGAERGGAPSLKGVVLFTLGLAAATLLWRIPVPQGTYVPVLGLPTPYFLPQYAAMFAAGVVAFRRGWFEALPGRAGRAGFVVAGVATVVLLPPAPRPWPASGACGSSPCPRRSAPCSAARWSSAGPAVPGCRRPTWPPGTPPWPAASPDGGHRGDGGSARRPRSSRIWPAPPAGAAAPGGRPPGPSCPIPRPRRPAPVL